MGSLTVPTKGTPLDIEFIATLTDKVNQLETITDTGGSFISVVGDKTVTTINDLVFYANRYKVSFNTPKVGDTTTAIFQFTGAGFKSRPYIVAGISNDLGGAGDMATAVVTRSNADACTVSVVFNKASSGNVTVEVTVLAIGISNKI